MVSAITLSVGTTMFLVTKIVVLYFPFNVLKLTDLACLAYTYGVTSYCALCQFRVIAFNLYTY
jgi:hypothetical protein